MRGVRQEEVPLLESSQSEINIPVLFQPSSLVTRPEIKHSLG